ncbi:MAG TPA: SDR family NAD(P)-dependent oxidoreductase [Aliidongia sp.]|nr:SDR family NAD(P)-dependent oxidoreductase [Aliidongia sp.]
MSELAGRTILVTGAASGIGRAAAETLAEAGARLALLDRATIEGFADHLVLKADLADEATIDAAVEAADRRLGGIDGLVHAAGIFSAAPLTETALADFERIVGINLTGTFLVVRATVRGMKRHGRGGRIVTLGSELSALGREGHAGYCASKAAVAAMTRCWAREFGPEILVNTVAPGPTDTPMLDWPGLDAHWQKIESGNPLGRIGRPAEIASVIRFLMGSGAGFVTGQTIGVNGGAVMG